MIMELLLPLWAQEGYRQTGAGVEEAADCFVNRLLFQVLGG
jgi:hypothetical protein